jgi:hypothetical protein
MFRTTTFPAKTVTEDISFLEETPPDGTQSGSVRVTVGNVDANGAFIFPQQFQVYFVTGADYAELNGPPTTWAPDKPDGTYRNEDLWHYVDLQRAAQ